MEAVLPLEPYIRIGAFCAVAIAMALWEIGAPRRRRAVARRIRWVGNLGIVVVNTALVRLLFPLAVVGFALQCETRGWGLLSLAPIPGWASIVIGVVALDFVLYGQHVLFHAVPALWRLHRMHHADLDFDFTTGIRFHPVEIILSVGIKLLAIAAIGAPAVSVLLFEVVLNATSMFNHGNVRLAGRLDRVLRWVVVTPDMHRVHHSVLVAETNSNFGFNLPWWDRLLGTYRAQPELGHEDMTIGIAQFREQSDLRLGRMLLQPLRGSAEDVPLGRRDP